MTLPPKLGAPLARLRQEEPGAAPPLVEPALGGRIEASQVDAEVEDVRQPLETRLEGAATVARQVRAGERSGMAHPDQQLLPEDGQRRDAQIGHPFVRRPEGGPAVAGDPDTRAFGGEEDPLGVGRMERDAVDRQGRIAHRRPGEAAVGGGVEAAHRAGQQLAPGQGGEGRGAALDESFLEALPVVAAIHGSVDPAAGGGPDLAGAPGDRGQAEHLRVEDHAVEDAGPGAAPVGAAVGAAPGAGDHGVRLQRIGQEAGDLLHLRQVGGAARPGGTAVYGFEQRSLAADRKAGVAPKEPHT